MKKKNKLFTLFSFIFTLSTLKIVVQFSFIVILLYGKIYLYFIKIYFNENYIIMILQNNIDDKNTNYIYSILQ